MAFKVTFSNRATTNYKDDANFAIEKSGVLVVTHDDGRRQQFGPTAWFSVEDAPHNTVEVTTGVWGHQDRRGPA